MANLSFLKIAGLAVGAAVVSGATILVTASAAGFSVPFFTPSSQAGSPSTASIDQKAGTPSPVCTDFVSHFSADLKLSQGTVNAAFQKAIGQTLADEVKNGKLTQARADAIMKRLAGRAPCAIAGSLNGPGSKLGAFRPALLSAAASALGITDQALKTDLGQGMTLSQIATTQKVSEAQFRTLLIAKLTPVLDAAVTNKKLTPAQDQAIIKRLQTGAIPLWNKPAHAGKAAATPAPANT
jgi:hypothetical protein